MGRSKSFPVTNPIGKEFSTGEKAILFALDKIPKSTKWDIQEEYIIETLFHEIEHANAKGFDMAAARNIPFLEGFIESVHQLHCRYRYGDFFTFVTGKAPLHQERIIAAGTAYSIRAPNLDKMLSLMGYNPEEKKALLKELATNSRYPEIAKDFLRLNKKLKIEEAAFLELTQYMKEKDFIEMLNPFLNL